MDNATCLYPGCGRNIESLGYCQTHNRQRRNGKPLKPIRNYDVGLSSIERFMKRVYINPDNGCWVWNTHKDGEYPRFIDGGKSQYAHRWIWEYTNGPIPPGWTIDHKYHCYCVNPDHLRVCTHAENTQNLKVQRNNTSGYRGVTLHRRSGLWHAAAKLNGKKYSFGYYKTAHEAGIAAAEGRARIFTHSMN